MKKNVWSWAINNQDGDYWVSLHKHTLWDEILDALGGWLIQYGWTYRLGNKLIIHYGKADEVLLNLPITKAQAVAIGWDWDFDE